MTKIENMKFIESVDRKVRKTISKYKLFTPDDKIVVAVSGGKDSTVCLYILKKLGYNIEAVSMDISIKNYSDENLKNIKNFCKSNKIKLHVLSFKKILEKSLKETKLILDSKGFNYSYCMICGTFKKYFLNKFSKDNKFDYLATGHNLDDESEAFLMNLFRSDYSHAIKQGPKSKDIIPNAFVSRVKPLYFISNKETRKYSELMNFPINYNHCPLSSDAHRRKFRNLLNDLEINNPAVKNCIINFLEKMKNNSKDLTKRIPNYCKSCGELCSKIICKKCQIIKDLQK
jgi:tRNA-5-methyluridine54 2-sulfurtransferase